MEGIVVKVKERKKWKGRMGRKIEEGVMEEGRKKGIEIIGEGNVEIF